MISVGRQRHAPASLDRRNARSRHWLHSIAFAAIALSAMLARGQDSVEAFYADRTVTIYVGSGPGGVTDVSARIIGEYLERHLPGNPTVIVQNMPGGGSVTMANYLYRSAPRDGTALGYPVPGMITAELLEPNRTRYEGRRLNWIGSAFRSTNTLSVLDSTGVKAIDDAREQQVFVGASGRGSPLYQLPALARSVLGIDLEIITGYEGGTAVVLAMERGEVDGQTIALDFWQNLRPEWLASGRLVHLFRIGPPDPRAPGVPHLSELVTNDADRALIEFMEIGVALGWPLFAPPDVPPERVAALRQAFDALVADPAFASAVDTALHIAPSAVSGTELTASVERALATPPELVARAVALMDL
jgi:tripartite-type tricarboxylate transporter receptor subunit TctC